VVVLLLDVDRRFAISIAHFQTSGSKNESQSEDYAAKEIAAAQNSASRFCFNVEQPT